MNAAILYSPPSIYYPSTVPNPFFDSSLNLTGDETTTYFSGLRGKATPFSATVGGFIFDCNRTLAEVMRLLWLPRAWSVQFDDVDHEFPGIARTTGGGGYYPKFELYRSEATSVDRFTAEGVIGSNYVQLPVIETPGDPVNSLYDPGWVFTFYIYPDGESSYNLSSTNRAFPGGPPACGTLTINCGPLTITETIYGEEYLGNQLRAATLTALF